MTTSDKNAAVAVITGDTPGERYITLGQGDGTFQRWHPTEGLARKIRRELNERLDQDVSAFGGPSRNLPLDKSISDF